VESKDIAGQEWWRGAVAEVSLPGGQWRNLNNGIGIAEIPASGSLSLGAWQATIVIKTGDSI